MAMNPKAVKGLKAALDKKLAAGEAKASTAALRKKLHQVAPGVRHKGTPPYKEK